MSDRKHILHLYWRAGFGLGPKELNRLEQSSLKRAQKDLFAKAKKVQPLDFIDRIVTREELKQMSKAEREAFRKTTKRQTRQLSVQWLQRMSNGQNPLREKMTLFWHGHFATRIEKAGMVQQLNNTMREHALGNFKDLVIAVSKEPVMLQFLNNQQNKKEHPNENFARELMELFTIGRGNYTETDVKEAARAFTGWSYDRNFQFRFNTRNHDSGEKTFLGQAGNFQGEDIIDILLQQEETAKFITRKIYRYFVNDQINESRVEQLASQFRQSDYNIELLMHSIFESDWFYDAENIGCKIKSPVELIVGLNTVFAPEYNKPEALHFLMKLLGQILFYPPNVAGWPGGKRWIDSSTLMLRLKLPSAVLNGGVVEFESKDDLDTPFMDEARKRAKSKLQRKLQSTCDWDRFESEWEQVAEINELTDFLLLPALSDASKALFSDLKLAGVKERALELISLPEYQLC